MRLPNDKTKFTSQFKYVEIARYWAEKDQLPREKTEVSKGVKVPRLFDIDEVPEYIKRKGDTGIYTSIFQYNSTDLFNSTCLGPLYFDFDSEDIELAKSEAFKVVRYLLDYIPEGAIRFYFSGQKGFHIECEPIALGISSSDDLPGVFRLAGEDIRNKLQLTTMDFNVYDWRRMWRLPNTRHQRTGLFKVEIMQLFRDNKSTDDILKYAKEPRIIEIPEQVFDYKANRWYREYVYQLEKQTKATEQRQQDLLSKFLADGSGHVRTFGQDRIFDRARLFNNCSAVKELDKKAREEHYLTHYERLFLCSLLTYDEEAIKYLHEILSKCADYRFEISDSHIEDWIRRREYDIGGRPFTCQKAKEVGISCSDCGKMEPRKKVIKLTDGKYIETDEVSMPSPLRWAYSAKEK